MFWMQPRPTWWLVIIRPSGETKEPEPPSLKRTEASRTRSSHSLPGAKPYFSLSSFNGRLSKVHMPSSAAARAGRARTASRAVRRMGAAFIGVLRTMERRVRSGPLLERDVVALGRAFVDLARAGDLLVLVLQHLFPLREPSRGTGDGEEHGKHVLREAHGLIDEPGIEVHVGIELPLHEVVVLEGDPLQLEGDVEQRVAPCHLELLVRHRLYDLGSGIDD